jgi:hypothetical protein
MLGGDLHIEEQPPGCDEAVEPAAGRRLGAAERGGEIGHRDAAVPADLGQQYLVLSVEDDGCREPDGGRKLATRSGDAFGLCRGQGAGAAVPAGSAAEEGVPQHAGSRQLQSAIDGQGT